ncbi:MAG: DUF58 domain-containing protein [Verrucomicrobia bacterium]|nr:DUF58 domain-containing protein [Verrucomicrobiota bacterium]
MEVVVWPQSIPTPSATKAQSRSLPGRQLNRTGGGHDLHKLRPYTVGDPPRTIHWKASARLGKWLVKELQERRQPMWHLILDPGSWRIGPILPNDSELDAGISLMCAAVESQFIRNELASVKIDEHWIPVFQNKDAWTQVMDFLACITVEDIKNKPPVSHMPSAPQTSCFCWHGGTHWQQHFPAHELRAAST